MAEEKKERFEILLEEIRDKVQVVSEGHEIIRSEMKQMEGRIKSELRQEISSVHTSLKKEINAVDKKLDATAQASYGLLTDVQKDVKEVKGRLNEHTRQPAHAV